MIYVLGGTSLNYKVVGGTTQPTSTTENMIWVNTSTAITSHVFSATQPTSPAAGMVWFDIGTSSNVPMNIAKKNEFWVYPTTCQQYVGGAWVTKEAKTYLNGAWIDWATYWIKDGVPLVTLRANHFTYTTENGALVASYIGSGYHNIGYDSDLADYKTMEIEIWNEAGNSKNLAIWLEAQVNLSGGVGNAANLALPLTAGYVTYKLDISALGGQAYQNLITASGNTRHKVRIKNWKVY